VEKFLNISLLVKVDSALIADALNSDIKDSFDNTELFDLKVQAQIILDINYCSKMSFPDQDYQIIHIVANNSAVLSNKDAGVSIDWREPYFL
jgi:hypothetical protein